MLQLKCNKLAAFSWTLGGRQEWKHHLGDPASAWDSTGEHLWLFAPKAETVLLLPGLVHPHPWEGSGLQEFLWDYPPLIFHT